MASQLNNDGINTGITWCHYTANLWWGCVKCSPGCDHCYAETLSHRWGHDIWGPDKPRMVIKSVWNDLNKYQKLAAAAGEIHRVFVGSMMDIFEKPMPVIESNGMPLRYDNEHDEIMTSVLRDRLFINISENIYPNLLFLFLTKRPSNINKYIPENWKTDPPKNVMFGTSPCDQKTADTLIPQLLQVNGKRFLSIEPLLGPINLSGNDKGEIWPWIEANAIGNGIDWVIVGGESGHEARPMHPDWVRSLRDQCKEAAVPFFLKQWGEWAPPKEDDDYDTSKGRSGKALIVSKDGTVHCFKDTAGENAHVMLLKGKKAAGRELDGKIYDEFPVV